MTENTTAMSPTEPKFGFKGPGFADIGNVDSVCPYCNEHLEERPKQRKRCPICGNVIRVKTRPSDRSKVLLTAAQAKEVDDQWEIHHSTYKDSHLKESDFKKAKAELTTKYAGEPSDADVYWAIYVRSATEHEQARNWGLYRNARLKMADVLKKEGLNGEALDMYIEVSYLDANGPNNVGGYSHDPKLSEGPSQFDPERARQAPSVVGRIESVAKGFALDEADLKKLYLEVASQVQRILNTPASPESAWAAYMTELDDIKKWAEEARTFQNSLVTTEKPAETLSEARVEVSRLAANLKPPDRSVPHEEATSSSNSASDQVALLEELEDVKVPKFTQDRATATLGRMNRKQKVFFHHLLDQINQGHFPPVGENVSYLYACAHSHIKRWRKKDYASIREELTHLATGYSYEQSFATDCIRWANDCLLAQGNYDEFLETTRPADPLSSRRGYRDERWSIFKHLGRPLPLVDFLSLAGLKNSARPTNYTLDNLARYWAWFEVVYTDEATRNGPWLERLLEKLPKLEPRRLSVFSGSVLSTPKLDLPVYNFMPLYPYVQEESSRLSRMAEDRLRVHDGVPRIGEGWVSETALYWAVKKAFPQTEVVQHGRPDWLGLQHFDIWMPEWDIAIEYHGRQHFEPVDFFGGEEAFVRTVERDNRKKALSRENGVELLIVTETESFDEVTCRIESIHHSRPSSTS